MLLTRRDLLQTSAAALAASLAPHAFAQAFDTVRLITGFPPGGTSDTICRRVASKLAPGYGKSVVVENRAGAGGQIAVQSMKQMPADGTAILQTPMSMLGLYPHIYKKLQYDPQTDVMPVSLGAVFDFGFAVGPAVPASVRNIPEFLAWCKANRMYLILDLHAAPGGQGKDANISDYDPAKPSLWENEANRQKTIALWRKLAERYASEPWIGGYDLLNEPNWTFEGKDKNGKEDLSNKPIWDLYRAITKAIREVDRNHLIIIEGNGWGNNYNGFPGPWDENLVMSFHKYWNPNTQEAIARFLALREKYHLPLWLGESGENNNQWFRDCVALVERNHIGWSWWPHKKVESASCTLTIQKPNDFKKVVDYWNKSGDRPSREIAAKALFELAENCKASHCRFNTNVVQALIPTGSEKPALHRTGSLSKFKVLALAESGGHHIEFTKAAKPWLDKCGEENGFEVDYLTNTAPITEAFLANYRLLLQLDFVPYGWKPEAMAAFQAYIEQGRGGWVGLHHATLLGEFDGYPMWPWFSAFMGKIKFKNYIPNFSSGTVHVEDKSHPCMKGLPESFVIPKEEWYTYDVSPRANVRVLASVDESTYSDASAVRMGDHPVIWTNEHMKARNIYIFMGHGPWLLQDKAFTTLLGNAILWAAEKPSSLK